MVTQKSYSSLSVNWLSVVLGMQFGIMNYLLEQIRAHFSKSDQASLSVRPCFLPLHILLIFSPPLSVKKVLNVAGQSPVLVAT